MYVCICRGIREMDLVRVAAVRPLTAELLIGLFELDGPECCGRCAESAESMAALANAQCGHQARSQVLERSAERGALDGGA